MRKIQYAVFWFLLGFLALESSLSLAQEKSRLKIMLIAWADVGIQEKVFLSELEKLGYQVQPEFFAAKLDRNALATFLRTTFESKVLGFDYVYTFGTTASLMAQSIIKNRVPHLFHSVNDPIGSGLVSSLKTTGVNINGFTDGVSVAAQLSLMRQTLPLKSIGLIFNPRESNSNLERQKIKTYCEEFGIKYEDIRVTQEPGQLDNIVAIIKEKKINVDLIILPQDSFIATNQKKIIDAINFAKIPSFGTIRDYHDSGALIVMTPDFEKGGRKLAAMIDEHQQGALLSQLPVITDEQPKIIVNEKTAQLLGLAERLKDK